MAAAPLQPLTTPLDGTTASALNFGSPVVNALQGLLGNASGGVDANNGAPMIPRSHKDGLLSYTNATNAALFPGVSVFSAWSSTSAIGQTVPNGQMAVVPHFYMGGVSGSKITVATGVGTYNLAFAYQGATLNYAYALPIAFPLVLDQGWTLTVPTNASFSGYTVQRDAAVTPVVMAVTTLSGTPPVGGYTVPAGKTLYIYGCINTATSSVSKLLAGPSFPICIAASDGASSSTLYGGSGIVGPAPVVVAAGTVLQSDTASGVTFWGVLI